MISIRELREITEQSKTTAKENFRQWLQEREESITQRLKEQALKGERSCCYPFPQVINEYPYTRTEMEELLKKEFPDFTITLDTKIQGNYWCTLEW
jgi:hypothetical protein